MRWRGLITDGAYGWFRHRAVGQQLRWRGLHGSLAPRLWLLLKVKSWWARFDCHCRGDRVDVPVDGAHLLVVASGAEPDKITVPSGAEPEMIFERLPYFVAPSADVVGETWA